MNFALAVLSSLVASIIVIAASRVSFRWLRAFPRGVQFVPPNRHKYASHIAALIRSNKQTFFFKGLTGFDLFSNDLVKCALEETRIDTWKRIVFVFTDSKSPAFQREPNRFYTAERLNELQKVVVEYLTARVLNMVSPHVPSTRGILYVNESLTLVNLLVLDNDAYVFFRGFTNAEGPNGQVIVRVVLSKCPPRIRELIEHVCRFYAEQLSGTVLHEGANTPSTCDQTKNAEDTNTL